MDFRVAKIKSSYRKLSPSSVGSLLGSPLAMHLQGLGRWPFRPQAQAVAGTSLMLGWGRLGTEFPLKPMCSVICKVFSGLLSPHFQ